MKNKCNFRMNGGRYCSLKHPDIAHGVFPICDGEENCMLWRKNE